MNYISTRGTAPVLGFGEAMMTGLARDGGLYVPETVPTLTHAEIAALAGAPYEEVAFKVMRPYLGGFFTDDEFQGLIAKAYQGFHHAARAPMVQLGANHFLLGAVPRADAGVQGLRHAAHRADDAGGFGTDG